MKNQGITIIQCGVCSERKPSVFGHSHHVRPQAAGGSAVDEVDLCAGCHTNVHQIANMLMSSKASLAEDTIKIGYPNKPAAQQKCFELSLEVVKWMSAKKDGTLQVEVDQDNILTIELPPQIKHALKVEASQMRHASSKRKVGMSTLASSIISDFFYRKYPALRKPQKTLDK